VPTKTGVPPRISGSLRTTSLTRIIWIAPSRYPNIYLVDRL
jgi:hypothetical protein